MGVNCLGLDVKPVFLVVGPSTDMTEVSFFVLDVTTRSLVVSTSTGVNIFASDFKPRRSVDVNSVTRLFFFARLDNIDGSVVMAVCFVGSTIRPVDNFTLEFVIILDEDIIRVEGVVMIIPVDPLTNPVNEFESVMTSVVLDEADEDGEMKFTFVVVGGLVAPRFVADSSLVVIVVAMSVLSFDVLPEISVSFVSFPTASLKQNTTQKSVFRYQRHPFR